MKKDERKRSEKTKTIKRKKGIKPKETRRVRDKMERKTMIKRNGKTIRNDN